MPARPASSITFLFTDIEGSTRLWEQQPDDMRDALAAHDRILRGAVEKCGGRVFKTMGDALCAAFPLPPEALAAALQAQDALRQLEGMVSSFKVRMAIHAGPVLERDDDYFGPTLSRTARILDAANGGMLLLSEAACAAELQIPSGYALVDRGTHRLKDITEPEHLFQVTGNGLASPESPLRTASEILQNLPKAGDDFVGRERETKELTALLAQPDARLVTLTGAGGSGKTRLALQTAGRVADRFANGVWWVDLARVRQPESVLNEILTTLQLPQHGGLAPADRLIAYLRERELLLVLDNFEQVVEAAVDLDRLLRACPRLSMLVTSRERLNMGMEREFPVAPLEERDSVQLFDCRARQANPAFVFSESNAEEVAAICRRLEGLPLAVELAAARVRGLTLAQILGRLDHRFDLLAGRRRDVTDRQRTMRGAVGWSYDLLTEAERRLFASLAVFTAGFTLDAVESVCGDESFDTASLICSLCDKSLLRLLYGEDEPRYTMLETLREYGHEKLVENGLIEEIERRHAHYFLDYLRAVDPVAEQMTYLARATKEIDNLRAGMDAAARMGDDRLLADYGLAWRSYFHYRGLYKEGIERLGQAEEALRRLEDRRGLCSLLLLRGIMLYYFDLDVAYGKASECLELAREAGDREMQMRALNLMGLVFVDRKQVDEGIALMQEALAHAREMAMPAATASIVGNLGWALMARGEGDAAIPLLQEAAALSRNLGNRRDLGLNLQRLGMGLKTKNPREARKYLEEGVKVAWEVGDTWTLSNAQWNLGEIERAEDNRPASDRLFLESIRALDEIGLIDSVLYHVWLLIPMAIEDHATHRAARLMSLFEAGTRFEVKQMFGARVDPDIAKAIPVLVGGATYESMARAAADLSWRGIVDKVCEELDHTASRSEHCVTSGSI